MALKGNYCFSCGQNKKRVDKFFLALVAEAFEDIFSWNSRTLSTIFALIFKPGFLTREYFVGRRARYLPPLRLYIISSLLFFLYLSFQNTLNTDFNNAINTSPTSDSSLQLESNTDIDEAIADIKLDWLEESANKNLRETIQTQANKAQQALQDDPGQIAGAFLDIAPALMFILLPLFALLLKFVYITSGRYYAEHLVLALHNHSALFLVLLFSFMLDWVEELTNLTLGSTFVLFWIPVYMFLSLKRAFNEGTGTTILKFSILANSYLLLFSFAFAFGWLAGIMTL